MELHDLDTIQSLVLDVTASSIEPVRDPSFHEGTRDRFVVEHAEHRGESRDQEPAGHNRPVSPQSYLQRACPVIVPTQSTGGLS